VVHDEASGTSSRVNLRRACGQNFRIRLTARVQLQSRLMGEHIYHPEGAHAALRNARSMSLDDYYDSLQWLYGGSGLAEGSSAIR
jgi:salicylate hydroxylase